MKILSITLHNLASIDGFYEIDFTQEPLESAGLFAISGPTGAGKSTILDALCLALYDKTPRFADVGEKTELKDVGDKSIKQHDVKNILRRGAGEGFAEVTFRGVDGVTYRSRWSVRRARQKADGALQDQVIQVTNLSSHEELQGGKTDLLVRLTDLTGLTYEQFTRTVLLAQNDFATFLKSQDREKAELLEKLTGTEIYSQISQAVYEHNKLATEEMKLRQSRMQLIELLPNEELEQLRTRKEELIAKRAVLGKHVEKLQEEQNIVHNLRAQQEVFNRKKEEAELADGRLKQAEAQHKKQSEEHKQFMLQLVELQPSIRKARDLDVQIEIIQGSFTQAENMYRQASVRKAEAEKSYTEKVKLLEKELNSLPAAPTLDSPEIRIEVAEKELRVMEQALQHLTGENEKRIVALNAYNIQTVGEEQKKLLDEQKMLQTKKQATENWLRQHEELKQAAKQLAKQQTLCEKSEKEWKELCIQLQAKEEQKSTLERLYETARLAMGKDVKALRGQLKHDEPCPVCGATSHPYHDEAAAADSMFKQIETEFNDFSTLYRQFNNQQIAAEQQTKQLKKLSVRLGDEYNTAEQTWRQNTPINEEERSIAHFNMGLEKVSLQLEGLAATLKAYHSAYGEWQSHDKQLKEHQAKAEGFKENIRSCKTRMQQVEGEKKQLDATIAYFTTEKERFDEVSDKFDTLKKERAQLLKGMSVTQAEASMKRKEEELLASVAQSQKAVEQCRLIASGLQGEIKQLGQTVESLLQRAQQIEQPEQLAQQITEHQTTLQQTEKECTVLEARLLEQAQNKAKLKVYAEEYAQAEANAIKWGKLNELIGSADGRKFKVIAQGYTLNLLLRYANTHLAYLSRRYKLQQVRDTLALQVVDCDMGDEIRTVYSLSGGETFLISLALALGLSSLSGRNLKVESLFIDEGFGSLDAESLSVVMSALEQLQMQGRKIGVISHVQEMSERISVQIQVQKMANGKSRIEIVG